MKHMLTGLALASAAVLVAATPAQGAAPKNPVAAVKKTYLAGKGVKFAERTTFISGRSRQVFVRRTGALQFSRSGIAASDITGKLNINADDLGSSDDEDAALFRAFAKPERTIRVGTTAYSSGNIWAELLPEGKTWFKAPNGTTGGFTGTYGQPLNVAELATLKTLLKDAKPATGGYAGKITVGELRKVSPRFRASAPGARTTAKVQKIKIGYRLSVNANGLPTRVVTTFPLSLFSPGSKASETATVDTRYTGWGGKVAIKAPPADQVTTKFADDEDETLENLDNLEMLDGVVVAQ